MIVWPEIKQKQPQDRKTIFETLSLPVTKILSPVARQAPTKPWSAFPFPENQTMVWVSPFPGKYRGWGGLRFGLSFVVPWSQKHWGRLGVHALSLEREMSTSVLADLRRELAKFKWEFAKLKREFAKLKRYLARISADCTRLWRSLPRNRRN